MIKSTKVTLRTIFLTLGLVASSGAAILVTPKVTEMGKVPTLEDTLPRTIGEWRALHDPRVQVSVATADTTDITQPYDQTVLRSYVNPQGNVIQMAVAWGKRQRQEVKIHRPELCYPAQGFEVLSLKKAMIPMPQLAAHQLEGKRMVTRDRNGQTEVVSYWIRIGHSYADNSLETRMHIFREGLAGRVPDGVLVRVSQRISKDANPEPFYRQQEAFATSLVAAVDPETQRLLVR